MKSYIKLGNLKFNCLKRQNLELTSDRFLHLVTVNSSFFWEIRKNPNLLKIINENQACIDGQILYLLIRSLGFKHPIEKISGSDIIEEMTSENNRYGARSVFFLGSTPEVIESAIQKCESGLRCDGYAPKFGFSITDEIENMVIFEKIKRLKPDILFVALGCPKQEFWIETHRQLLAQCGVKLAVGCGGALDFYSDKIKRCPKYLQKLGLEGLYRFYQQPTLGRVKRILISCYVFWVYLRHQTVNLVSYARP